MSEISALEPKKVWYFFDLLCSVPHISKHEAAAAEKFAAEAEKAGLEVIRDNGGNVIIKRPASEGFEDAPRIIMQAHMDMVPASEGEFDFINTPITPYIDGDWVKAKGTTLGADDGIGVANAMAVITDKDFKCGALTVILTADEEAGMSGARQLDPAHLEGRYMLNLDGGDKGFCIACAGGLRQETTFSAEYVPAPAGETVKITVGGLPGGHSGGCIHEDRGNALKFLADCLDCQSDIHVAAMDGGSADNVIPAGAVALAVTDKPLETVQKQLDAYALMLKKECEGAKNVTLTVEKADKKLTQVWSEKFRSDLLSAMILIPNGVMDFDDDLGIVKTSSNLATIATAGDKVIIRTSQRSLSDESRQEIAARIRTHFELFGGTSQPQAEYPATPPKKDSSLLKKAVECAEKRGKRAVPYAIHAGLETGWFSMKNPAIEIISCGPAHTDLHTPNEKLNIPSVGEFDKFLRELLAALAK
ncbi:MAG: aminoacyl-histidine dipeptidase [Lentisphaerae bacterium]|nr:aminoacyl-histidine dipeptidase [Lentisphaerota bacterium]